MVCADPESVVIRGPGHWRSLMTGLWPVLAFVCLECSTPQQGFCPAGTACWPLAACLGWRGGWSRRYSRLNASWSPVSSLFHSPPLLPELLALHPGTRSGCWRRLHFLAPPGSTAPCHYLSHSQSSASSLIVEPLLFTAPSSCFIKGSIPQR